MTLGAATQGKFLQCLEVVPHDHVYQLYITMRLCLPVHRRWLKACHSKPVLIEVGFSGSSDGPDQRCAGESKGALYACLLFPIQLFVT